MMSASVKAPVYTSVVHRKLQHHNWQGTDVDCHPDDFALDLIELSGIAGFLMNEHPDNLGLLHPPWTSEPEPLPLPLPVVKPEPMIVESNSPRPPPGRSVPSSPMLDTRAGTSTSKVGAVNTSTSVTRVAQRAPTTGVGSTLRKTAAGGVTRRRSSSKEEQAKKRRERNRVLARRTRLRKKFFFQSLQQQVNTGVSFLLDYVEDIYEGVLFAPVSILNPNPIYLPLPLGVL